jgi:hypothetical protein
MKKDSFFFEFIKSGPFILLLILAIIILLGIMISNRHEKSVQMKEDILYISPKPKK